MLGLAAFSGCKTESYQIIHSRPNQPYQHTLWQRGMVFLINMTRIASSTAQQSFLSMQYLCYFLGLYFGTSVVLDLFTLVSHCITGSQMHAIVI